MAHECVVQTLRAANALWRASRRLFRPFGLSDAHFNVLNVLGLHAQGMSQRELSDVFVVDRSNMTLLLDQMEKRAWVQRRDEPGDRRAYRVRLTRTGRALWQKVLPSYCAAVREVVGELPTTRAKEMLAALKRIEAEAKEWKPNGNH